MFKKIMIPFYASNLKITDCDEAGVGKCKRFGRLLFFFGLFLRMRPFF
jgi:hypothetical protein